MLNAEGAAHIFTLSAMRSPMRSLACIAAVWVSTLVWQLHAQPGTLSQAARVRVSYLQLDLAMSWDFISFGEELGCSTQQEE